MSGQLLNRGLAAVRRGDYATAERVLESLLRTAPDNLEARVGLINALMEQGRPGDALPHLEFALKRMPDHRGLRRGKALALNRLGTSARRAGDAARALGCFESALAVAPELSDARYNLALCLIEARQYDRAERQLGRIGPPASRPDLMFQTARIALGRGAEPEAKQWLLRALAAKPDDALLALDIGDALVRLWEDERAITAYRAARRAGASAAEVDLRCAALWGRGGRRELAVKTLTSLLEQPKFDRAARRSLIALHVQDGDRAAARSLLRADLPATWHFRARLEAPSIAASSAAIAAMRREFAQESRDLLAAPARGIRSLGETAWTNFYLSYHGQCNRELRGLSGDLIAREIAAYRPQLLEPPKPHAGGRRRIGFLSTRWGDNVVGHYFGRWIAAFGAAGWETWCYLVPRRVDPMTATIQASADHAPVLTGPADSIAGSIRGDQLDVMIVPEVGIDAMLAPLASVRLARTQLAAWGLPDTTGLPSMDGFLSVAAMEPEDAAAHYRERLLTLPGLGTCYPRPPERARRDRSSFGLPPDERLYLFPHSHFKVHPDMDRLLAEILERDPRGRLVMFETHERYFWRALSARMRARFEQHGLDLDSRVLLLPAMPRREYLAVNACCDVLLDTLHFSGGNTSLDALSAGLPVVTLPGALMRGRQTAAMLRLAGLDELIARDPEDYIVKAITVARHDADGARIAGAVAALIDDDRPLRALTEIVAEWV